jgi:hypothetical protein
VVDRAVGVDKVESTIGKVAQEILGKVSEVSESAASVVETDQQVEFTNESEVKGIIWEELREEGDQVSNATVEIQHEDHDLELNEIPVPESSEARSLEASQSTDELKNETQSPQEGSAIKVRQPISQFNLITQEEDLPQFESTGLYKLQEPPLMAYKSPTDPTELYNIPPTEVDTAHQISNMVSGANIGMREVEQFREHLMKTTKDEDVANLGISMKRKTEFIRYYIDQLKYEADWAVRLTQNEI